MFLKQYDHQFLPKYEIPREVVNGVRHYRTPEGNLYPSVTTVLDSLDNEALEAWQKMVGPDQARQIARLAAGRGSDLHSHVESVLLNKTFQRGRMMPTTYALFKAVSEYLTHINTIYAIEHPLFSNVLKTGGTVDLVSDYRGKKSVIDLKSSSKQKERDHIKSYFLQVTAYSIMLEEMYGFITEQLVILIACEDSPRGQEFIIPRDEYLHETKRIFQEYACSSGSTVNQSH